LQFCSLQDDQLKVLFYRNSSTTNEIFKILAQKLDFKPISRPLGENIFDVQERLTHPDIMLTESYMNEPYMFSSALYTDYLTFTVPAGEPYTQLEKMFLMFDNETWICIGVTLALAVLMIQLINFMSISSMEHKTESQEEILQGTC
jgi:hypothetical protein